MRGDRRLGRREVLVGVGAAGMGLLAATAPTAALADGKSEKLAGTYLANGGSDVDNHTFQLVAAFATGGVFSLIATDAPGVAFLGQWLHRGDHGFSARFVGYSFDGSGNLASTGRVDVFGTLDDAGIHATYAAVITDIHNVVTKDKGHFAGPRISAP